MMNMHKGFQLIGIFLLLMLSCIDTIDVDIDSNSGNLVVDALITDEDGPHLIRLSRTVGYFDRFNPVLDVESGAELTISDSNGSIIQLTESEPGTYITPDDFKAEFDVEYILRIVLKNGKTYQSQAEEMVRNEGIDSLLLVNDTRVITNDNNVAVQREGISINVKTGITSKGFYRWRYSGVYEIMTNPELRMRGEILDPLPCSGYEAQNGLQQVGPCTCCICWVTEKSSKAIISNELNPSANQEVFIDFLEEKEGKFAIRYFLEVEQLSLSKGAYAFWSEIENQQIQGSLFDQPNGSISSNITSVDDSDESVFGYFGLSSIDKKSRFINPAFFPFRVTSQEIIDNDCRSVGSSTNIKPTFW